jgi:hypothetical protein
VLLDSRNFKYGCNYLRELNEKNLCHFSEKDLEAITILLPGLDLCKKYAERIILLAFLSLFVNRMKKTSKLIYLV